MWCLTDVAFCFNMLCINRFSIKASYSETHTVKSMRSASFSTHCSCLGEKVLESPALPTGITCAPSNCNHLIGL